jgi:hypothetical protein
MTERRVEAFSWLREDKFTWPPRTQRRSRLTVTESGLQLLSTSITVKELGVGKHLCKVNSK